MPEPHRHVGRLLLLLLAAPILCATARASLELVAGARARGLSFATLLPI